MPPNNSTTIAGKFEALDPAPLQEWGLGESWRCRDPHRTGGVVVVKLLQALDPTVIPKLGEVLQCMKNVRHPNVLRVHSHGVWEGRPYVVHDFFEGSSLRGGLDRALASGERLSPELILEAFDGIAAALDAAHRSPKQVLHLGLDSTCVLMRRLPDKPLKVKVLDFSLAHLLRLGEGRGERDLSCVAPEVRGSGSPSPQSDVFSLGALLREMLMTPPEAVATSKGVGPQKRREDVPDAVWAEIVSAGNLDALWRPTSVREFAVAVHTAWGHSIPAPADPGAALAATPVVPQSPHDLPDSAAPPAVLTMPPLAGPLPAMVVAGAPPALPSREVREVVGETIALCKVAARRPPSPWDLGALRDERAEAEEEAAAGWLRRADADIEATMLASPPGGVRDEATTVVAWGTDARRRSVGTSDDAHPNPPPRAPEVDIEATTVAVGPPPRPPAGLSPSPCLPGSPLPPVPPWFAPPTTSPEPTRGARRIWVFAAVVLVLLASSACLWLLNRG